MQSEKRNNFVRLAENRTEKAIKAIRTIGKLGNKASYEYDENDAEKIIGALHRELEDLKSRLSDKNPKDVITFKLD